VVRGIAMEASMAQFFNRIVAAHYATRYATNYNRSWLADEEDCTNFVSQALYAGGWTMTAGRGVFDPDARGADHDDFAWYHSKDKVNTPLILLNPPHVNLFWKILDVFPDTTNYIDTIIANDHARV
jgi:Putative amidase domain